MKLNVKLRFNCKSNVCKHKRNDPELKLPTSYLDLKMADTRDLLLFTETCEHEAESWSSLTMLYCSIINNQDD